MHDTHALIAQFLDHAARFPGPVPGSVAFDFKGHAGHIVFGSVVHGNEVGSLPAVLECIQNLASGKTLYRGKVSFFLGNIEAAKKNVRFVESDLNRAFGANFSGPATRERKRALELTPLLNSADVFIDFHQTTQKCLKPFYVFAMHPESYYWARAVGMARTFITRKAGKRFSELGMCSDEYMRFLGKAGLTIELGQQGYSTLATNITECILYRGLKCMDKIYLSGVSLKKCAHKNENFEFLTITHREPFVHPGARLHDGFYNFSAVKKGAEIGVDENKKPIVVPQDGFLLFPKYPVRDGQGQAELPLAGELYVLASPFY